MRKISYSITQYHYDILRVRLLIWGRYPIQLHNITMISFVWGFSYEEDIQFNYTISLWYRSCEASHMRKISNSITQYHYDVVRVGHLIWGRYPIQSQNISMTSYVGGISYPTFCYFWCFFTINVTIESSISKKKAIIHILYFPIKTQNCAMYCLYSVPRDHVLVWAELFLEL